MAIFYATGGGAASVPDATTTVIGKVRLATIQEAQGNSEAIAVTPAGVQAAIAGIVGGMTFKGTYDAALSTPPLENAEQGDYYLVSNVKVNPSDTNTTYTRFGIEWAVGDHLVITEDMGGTIVDSRISKVDNSETVAQLNDLLDVTEALSAAGHVLIHDGTDYKNRALTTADIVGLAQHLYALLDVSLNELTSASYTTSTASLNLVYSNDYTIDVQGLDESQNPAVPYVKSMVLPATLNDDRDEIRVVNIGDSDLEFSVTGSAVFHVAGNQSTTPISVTGNKEISLIGEVRTYTEPDPQDPQQTIQVNKVAWSLTSGSVPSRMSLVRTGTNDWTNGFLTAADIVGVVTQGERELLQQELDRTQAGAGLNADGTLTVFAGNYINTNTSLRQAIQNLDTALKGEETARIAADSSEASARAAGDAGLQSQITQEINDRSAGDASLQGQINALATIATTGASADASVAHTALSYTPTGANVEAHIVGLDTQVNTLGSSIVTDVNGEGPVNGSVTIDGTHVDTTTTANNYTVVGASLDEHLDGIDTKLGDLQTELDATQTGAGLAADGTYTANGSANYIASATSLQSADNALDSAIKSTQDELDATQTGAGLDAAGTYTANAATNYIAAATSLKVADELLDAQVHLLGTQIVADVNGEAPVSGSVTIDGTHVDTTTTANNYTVVGASLDEHLDGIDTKLGDLQSELDTTQTGAGLNADGTYTANLGANYIASATSLQSADNALDSALKAEETARIAGDNALQTELDDTQTGAGLATDGSYTANAGANYIAAATSLANADDLLDAAIATLSATNVSTVNSQTPDLSGNVLLDGTHIDTATTANNYTVAGAQIDQHLDGIDTELGDLQTELNTTQTGAGLAADGTYTANLGANYIAAATSLKSADNALDSALKATQDELDATQTGAGLNTDGTYTAPTGTKHLGAATDLNNADVLLDAALATPNATNYTGTTTDTISTHLSGIDTALTTVNATNYTGATTDDLATHLGGIDSAIGLKAPIDSPTFTTAANAPTPTAGDNSTSIATTAFVTTAISSLSTTAQGTAGTVQSSDGSGGFASSQWEFDTTNGHLLPKSNDTYDIGEAENKVRDLYLGSNSLKFADDAATPNVISVGLTPSGHALGENKVQTTDGVLAIVNSDAEITSNVLAKVASTGSYSDLVDAPDSIIATSAFETTQGTYNLEAGKHYTFFPAAGATMTLVVPDTITGSGQPRGGDAIRLTNWGNGQLKLTTSGSSANTWLQYSQTLSQAQTGGGSQPEFIVESRSTVDLYGWSYSSGGTTYDPAWGIYFMSSMEINTKSLTTSGQMLVYDQTNDELVAGGLGDLSTTFAPTNYDNTVGATVVGDKIDHHLEGIDDKLANISLSELTDVNSSISPVADQVLLHDGTDFKAAALQLDKLTDVDTTTTAPVADDVLIFDGANFVPVEHTLANIKDVDLATTAPSANDFLKYDGTSWVPSVPTATVAALDDVGDVDTTGVTTGSILQYDGTNWVDGPVVANLASLTSASPTTSYSVSITNNEQVYLLSPTNAVAVTLPAPTTYTGTRIHLKMLTAQSLSISVSGGSTIDGQSSISVTAQYTSLGFVSDGSNWHIF